MTSHQLPFVRLSSGWLAICKSKDTLLPCLMCVAKELTQKAKKAKKGTTEKVAPVSVAQVHAGHLDLPLDLQPRLRQHIWRKHNTLETSEKDFLRNRARILLCQRLHNQPSNLDHDPEQDHDPQHYKLMALVGREGYSSNCISSVFVILCILYVLQSFSSLSINLPFSSFPDYLDIFIFYLFPSLSPFFFCLHLFLVFCLCFLDFYIFWQSWRLGHRESFFFSFQPECFRLGLVFGLG